MPAIVTFAGTIKGEAICWVAVTVTVEVQHDAVPLGHTLLTPNVLAALWKVGADTTTLPVLARL